MTQERLASYLSIEEYDDSERFARVRASYPAIRAFSPATFLHVNFPSRVTDEMELRRYADIMYELLPRREWLQTKRYSVPEVEAIRGLVQQIRSITASLFGSPVQPLMCLFPPIPLVRALESIARLRDRRLRVLEIGPGSGYLGAYLLNLGYQYSAMDNTQALYLWQNRFFPNLVEDFCEWAAANQMEAAQRTARCSHIPWWHFARFHENLPISADVIVCDAAMGEMDPFALYYVMRLAERIVAGSDSGSFLFQNLGETRINSSTQVKELLARSGFTGVELDGVSIFATAKSADILGKMKKLLPLGGAGARLFAPSEFLSIDSSELLESYGFFDFIRLGQ